MKNFKSESKKNALDILRSYPKKQILSDFYDDEKEFSTAITDIFGDSFEYPDFSHRTIAEVVKMAESEVAKVLPSPNDLTLSKLSKFGDGELLLARNGLNPQIKFAIGKIEGNDLPGNKLQLRLLHVWADWGHDGRGRAPNRFVQQEYAGFGNYAEFPRVDAMKLSKEDFAIALKESSSELDARISNNKEIKKIFDKADWVAQSALDGGMGKTKLPEPQELSSAEFAKAATIVKLENHGRQWEVFYGKDSMGFADGDSVSGALKQAHFGAVNNAIYANSPEAPDFMKGMKVFPPENVIAEYPELKIRFADVFSARSQDGLEGNSIPSHGDFDEKEEYLKKIIESQSGDLKKVYDIFKEAYGSSHKQGSAESDIYYVKRCSQQDLMDAEYGGAVFQEVADSLINSEPALAKIGPAFGIGQSFDFQVGEPIVANGFRGSVSKVLDGQLAGMLEVRLPGGTACVSSSFPDCFPAFNDGVEVVTEGRFIGPVKEVSGQFVVQDAGRGRLVAHECHRFDKLPEVGNVVDLRHSGGKVSFFAEKDKGRGNER